jgi:hypothetical protein
MGPGQARAQVQGRGQGRGKGQRPGGRRRPPEVVAALQWLLREHVRLQRLHVRLGCGRLALLLLPPALLLIRLLLLRGALVAPALAAALLALCRCRCCRRSGRARCRRCRGAGAGLVLHPAAAHVARRSALRARRPTLAPRPSTHQRQAAPAHLLRGTHGRRVHLHVRSQVLRHGAHLQRQRQRGHLRRAAAQPAAQRVSGRAGRRVRSRPAPPPAARGAAPPAARRAARPAQAAQPGRRRLTSSSSPSPSCCADFLNTEHCVRSRASSASSEGADGSGSAGLAAGCCSAGTSSIELPISLRRGQGRERSRQGEVGAGWWRPGGRWASGHARAGRGSRQR